MLGGNDVLLPEDRNLALDHESGALVGVGDDALAEDDAFTRLEFHLQRHIGLHRIDRKSVV